MTQPLTPTQADREAAARWAKSNSRAAQAANIRRGSCDIAPLVQAFARHAQAARLEGALAMREAAIANIETWFPGNTLGRPEYAAAKALRDSVAALDPADMGGR